MQPYHWVRSSSSPSTVWCWAIWVNGLLQEAQVCVTAPEPFIQLPPGTAVPLCLSQSQVLERIALCHAVSVLRHKQDTGLRSLLVIWTGRWWPNFVSWNTVLSFSGQLLIYPRVFTSSALSVLWSSFVGTAWLSILVSILALTGTL